MAGRSTPAQCPICENTRCTQEHWSVRPQSSISKVSLCVLPHHALLGFAPAFRCGCHAFGRWCACAGWRAVGGALMLTRCGCTAAVWMCGWDAPGNRIGPVASEQVASALRVCAAACREAPLFAARCRLALAMGISSRLSEHSVLADCPLDCISRCGFFCSTRLAIRVLVAQSAERSGGAARDTTSAVVEEGVPPPHASGA